MGCCGCSNKTSVVTGGILALIQSGIGLIFNIFFLNLYYGFNGGASFVAEEEILLVVTGEQIPLIRGLLIAATLLHIAWLISSIVVIIGNSRGSVSALRQWIFVTAIIIIGDVLFPILLYTFTLGQVVQAHRTLQSHIDNLFQATKSNYEAIFTLWKYYIILLFSYSKLGLITLITNICFCVYTNRRICDLAVPNTGHVLTTVPVPYGPGAVQVFPVTQQYGFPTDQQQGYPMTNTFKPVNPQPNDTKGYEAKF